MHIHSLSLSNFRNLAADTVTFSGGVNVLQGENGAGKSNLLEAVYVVCLGRSPRKVADTVMLTDNADTYRLVGTLETSRRSEEIAVAYQSGSRKKITADGVAISARELYERFAAVALGPQDIEIISGSPSARRLFLDVHLSQISSRYLSDLADYQKIVAQKNAALRERMDCGPFDELLVTVGSRLMLARQEFLRSLSDLAGDRYEEISSRERLATHYSPSVDLPDNGTTAEGIETAFREALDRVSSREAMLQSALVGPHRDEVAFQIGDLAARHYGSQGQWRTAAVALKLAVWDLLKQKRDEPPLLLLDEIFAELDAGRAQRLLASLGDNAQVFLTTALERVDYSDTPVQRYRVVDGRVEAVD